jgi:hypothetical protein
VFALAAILGFSSAGAGETLHPVSVPLTGLGTLLTGVATIRTHRWHGWHRLAPLLWGDRGAAWPSNRRLRGRATSATAGTGARAGQGRHPYRPRLGRPSWRAAAGGGRAAAVLEAGAGRGLDGRIFHAAASLTARSAGLSLASWRLVAGGSGLADRGRPRRCGGAAATAITCAVC